MKKALKITLIVVVVLLVVVFGGGMLISPKWAVTRSRVIPAKPEAVHAYVADFAKWPIWSPFEKEDPNIRITLGSPSSGVGAKRSWKSDKVGNGSQTIVKADPEHGTSYTLEIEGFAPFDSDMAYEPAGAGGTKVTWSGHGEMGANPIHRWFGLAMDGMLGKSYENGLADLEAAVVGHR